MPSQMWITQPVGLKRDFSRSKPIIVGNCLDRVPMQTLDGVAPVAHEKSLVNAARAGSPPGGKHPKAQIAESRSVRQDKSKSPQKPDAKQANETWPQ